MNNNNLYFPGELQARPIQLSDLGADNRSIRTIYEFKKEIEDKQIQKELENVLRLACDALSTVCIDLGIDPNILDFWDGTSEIIVTPFDPSI